MHAGFAGDRRISELNLVNHTRMKLGIYGYDSVHLPDYLVNKKVATGTDVIAIGKAGVDATTIVNNIDAGTNSFRVIKNPATEGNLFLLISDQQNADLFKAKNHTGAIIHTHHKLAHDYKYINTKVRQFEELTFFVGNTGRKVEKGASIFSLYSVVNREKKKELVSGVDDMQISYGIGTRGVGKYLPAREVTAALLWDMVTVVAVDLKMRGPGTKVHRLYINLREYVRPKNK